MQFAMTTAMTSTGQPVGIVQIDQGNHQLTLTMDYAGTLRFTESLLNLCDRMEKDYYPNRGPESDKPN